MHQPKTDAGQLAWAVIELCGRQVRTGPGGPVGLDFPAVLAMADVMGADKGLLADVLGEVEAIIVNGMHDRAERIRQETKPGA